MNTINPFRLLQSSLLLSVVLTASPLQPAELEIEAVSLSKSDLPRDFPFQVLTSGFAILKVTLKNPSQDTASFDPDQLSLRTRGRKRVKRALPTDITPKLMRFYRGTQRGVRGEVYSGRRRPYPGEMERAPTVEPGRSPGPVAADTATRLRSILEQYELQPTNLEPGASVEGYFYLKSKKHGRKLSGYQLHLDRQTTAIP